jgi:hypothetical protein
MMCIYIFYIWTLLRIFTEQTKMRRALRRSDSQNLSAMLPPAPLSLPADAMDDFNSLPVKSDGKTPLAEVRRALNIIWTEFSYRCLCFV